MTLAAVARIRGVPVVFGDILISDPWPNPGLPRPIPTRKDAGDFLPGHRSIAGVRRKMVILSDRLTVAWADSLSGAGRLIADLRGLVRDAQNLDRDQLFAFLDRPGYPNWRPGVRCDLVGWLVDDRGPIAFHWKSDGNVHAGGEEYVIGTGAKDFKANARPDFFYNSPDLPPHEQVVRIVLWLAGNATGREMFSGEPLRHLYGGTIEATLFAEGRFTPLTDITFLFWHVVTDLEGKDFRVTPMATFRSTVMSRMLSSYTRVESASTKGADQPTKRFMSPHMLTRVASHLRFRRFCPVSLSTTAIASAVGLSEMGQSGAV